MIVIIIITYLIIIIKYSNNKKQKVKIKIINKIKKIFQNLKHYSNYNKSIIRLIK